MSRSNHRASYASRVHQRQVKCFRRTNAVNHWFVQLNPANVYLYLSMELVSFYHKVRTSFY